MSNGSPVSALQRLKSTHESIMTLVGIGFGILLALYFFTFAQFIDHGNTGVVWFMAISSVLMVIALFRLRRLAFFLLRALRRRHPEYGPVLADMTSPDDLAK
ncbi:MAG: hypothetical protein LBV36_02895 [Chromatiales bacterium]|jgi:Kef-type K+ transport system membrane component KefB|nr:hypothetical protein [Chromatiales bacterium]